MPVITRVERLEADGGSPCLHNGPGPSRGFTVPWDARVRRDFRTQRTQHLEFADQGEYSG